MSPPSLGAAADYAMDGAQAKAARLHATPRGYRRRSAKAGRYKEGVIEGLHRSRE